MKKQQPFRNGARCLRLVVVASLTLIALPAAQSAERSPAEAQAAVETWVRTYTPDARPDAEVVALEPYIVANEVMAYVAQLAPEGFCLCGADNLVLPVYLYSPTGTYEPDIPGVQCVLDEIVQRTVRLRDLVATGQTEPYREALVRNESLWRDLAAGVAPPATAGTRDVPDKMILPLTCAWQQGSPYNDECPEYIAGTDKHTLAGCVPIAAAQTMYYWQWPLTGEGISNEVWYPRVYSLAWLATPLATNPNPTYFPGIWESMPGVADAARLEWTTSGGGTLRMIGVWDVSVKDRARNLCSDSAYWDAVDLLYSQLDYDYDYLYLNHGTTTFDWSLLKDVHTDPPGAPEAELAKLCYHVGVAIGVRYGVSTTSGDPSKVPAALSGHFRFDSDTHIYGWSGQTAIDSITDDLKWYRPVLVAGCGHEWVIYGYDSSYDPHRLFQMNMGWGSSTHAVWYTCDGTEPDWCSTLGSYQTMIAPRGQVHFVATSGSGDGSPDDPHGGIAEALSAVPSGGTLIFKAATSHALSGPLTINQPVTLKGCEVTIGAP